MLLGLVRMRLFQDARLYWTGVEVAGLTLLAVYFVMAWFAPMNLALLAEPLQWLIMNDGILDDGPEQLTLGCTYL